MSNYFITDELFSKAVAESCSIRQVLSKVGLAAAGGNYQTAKARIAKLGLNTDHFTGKGSNAGKKFGPKQPIANFLEKGYKISSHMLRLRLLSEGFKQHICEVCGLNEWTGRPIPLELHHVDGNHQNNTLPNLQLLCPNCHALTENYRGKNIGKNS